MRIFRRYPLLLPVLAMLVLYVPWLGEMYFYSKGEPREAIVAVSMLESGNWILPVSYGSDIPYKPPLLAWLIAVCSLIFNGGVVNEFTSRLPSALAAVALAVATWKLVNNRSGSQRAWTAMLILATCFEFFRAAVACRVDMVLTACTAGGIYALYTMKGKPLRVIWAILLLSGATLTKGPVGTLLPCLAMGIYFLLNRENFFVTAGKLTCIAIASFIIPAIWYWAAYLQGGGSFLSLAWEENIGRLSGTMGYDSHINPWYYNVTSLLAGTLPWTVPLAIAFCFRRVRVSIILWWKNLSKGVDSSLGRLGWTVGLTVFLFYCIPSSKRSVYLLPCYPFIAYGIAWLFTGEPQTRLFRYYSRFLGVMAVAAPFILIFLTRFPSDNPVAVEVPFYAWIVAFIPAALGCYTFTKKCRIKSVLCKSLWLTYAISVAYSATYAPAVMNGRSDVRVAEKLKETLPENAKIVSYIEEDSLMRYYTVNFYLDDRLRKVQSNSHVDGWLLTGSPKAEDSLRTKLLTPRSCDTRRPIYLVGPSR